MHASTQPHPLAPAHLESSIKHIQKEGSDSNSTGQKSVFVTHSMDKLLNKRFS